MPRHPIIESTDELFAIGQQLGKPIYVDSTLVPFVVFSDGVLSKCYGYCSSGTFTCEVFFDNVKKFTVSNADSITPVDLETGEGGDITAYGVVTFIVTAASASLKDIYIECAE